VGLSRKGYWHLSRTLATQTGMTNQWLKEQGLVSIKKLWVDIHYSAQADVPYSQSSGTFCTNVPSLFT